MYSRNYYKYKPYYVYDIFNCKKLKDIKKMLTNNVAYTVIKESIEKLIKPSKLFLNLQDNCGYNCLEIIRLQIDKLIQCAGTGNVLLAVDPNIISPIITNIETKIDIRYVNYIMKYGVPENGEFNEELLNGCDCDCD
jgi:hypothetical protein